MSKITPPDSVPIDIPLVRRLLAAQFPQWDGLPVRPVEIDGHDNRTFRLGDHMTVRLPSASAYVAQVEKEHRWLQILAPHLPLPIPVPLAMGVPSSEYPWRWSVYGWIEGRNATIERIADLPRFAVSLARFLADLQRIDPTDGPPPGEHNFFRGGPLAIYDNETRQAITALRGTIDAEVVTAIWEAALEAAWYGQPVWLHGDVAASNLLVSEGRLSAVIDFGSSGVGDPACDLAIAWTLFSDRSRESFRATLSVDDATWARGRGWALWKSLITMVPLPQTRLPQAERAREVLEGIVAEYKRDGFR